MLKKGKRGGGGGIRGDFNIYWQQPGVANLYGKAIHRC